MEGKTNTALKTAGVKTMDFSDLPRQGTQTPSVCPMCDSLGHDDYTQQLHTQKTLHFCSYCRKCFMTVPNTKSKKGQMTGFFSAKIKMLDQSKEVGFQCLLCNQMFGTLPDRNAHMGKHMGVNTHMCTKCGFVSNYKSVIDAHVVTHTKEYSHKCPVCCKCFATSTDMDQHLEMHLGDSLHRCQQCSFASPDVQAQIMTISLSQSEAEDHAGMRTQSINISITYSYASEHRQLVSLLGSHEDKSSHLARLIKSEGDMRSDHNYHGQGKSLSVGGGSSEVHRMLSVSNQPEKAAVQTLPQPGKDNRKAYNGEATQPGVARTLSTATSTLGKVILHNASVHVPDHATVPALHKPTKKTFKSQESANMLTFPRYDRCSVCCKTFACIQKLQAHMKLHAHGIIYKCPECGKKFNRSFDLKMHMASHTSKAEKDVKTDENCKEDKKHEADKNYEEDENYRADNTHETCEKQEADKYETDEKHEMDNHQQPEKNHKADKNQEAIVDHEVGRIHETPNHDAAKHHIEMYKCPVCRLTFEEKGRLIDHLENHSKSMYKCPVCSAKFKNKRWLNEHMEIHNACTLCETSFLSPEELNNHILTHTARNEVKCMICFKWFSDLPEHMEDHLISDSTETTTSQEKVMVHVPQESVQSVMYKSESTDAGKPHKCLVCGKAFAKKVYLLIHKHLHEPQKVHVCSLCGHAKTNRGNFTKHMKRHILDRHHQCSDCGKIFASQSCLKYHIQVKHTDGDKSVQCAICWKEYAHIAHLNKHMRNIHSEKKYTCLYCDKHFALKCRLNKHMHVHQGKGDYECSLCGKCFTTATALRVHEMVHTGEKPFMCSVCGKQFRTKSRLNEHMLTHTGEKPHMCAICGKTFASRPRLNEHMKYHTLKKTHECSECGKMFYSAACLKQHMTSHTDERPYLCSECGKSFKAKSILKRHAHIHQKPGRKKKKRRKKTEYEELTETVTEQPGLSSYNQPFIPLFVGGNSEPYTLTVEVVSDV